MKENRGKILIDGNQVRVHFENSTIYDWDKTIMELHGVQYPFEKRV